MSLRRSTRSKSRADDLAKTNVTKQDSSVTASSNTGDDLSTPDTGDRQGTDTTVSSWTGWAELENDPLIFATLLKEWGVTNVQVNEVVPLESVFNHSADETYGLIFLSPWAAPETENSVTEAPKGVWFANQTSAFSCATVALMNIINNPDNLDLGEKLNAFRSQTRDMSPMDRGRALDEFDHVRDVHNSFSTDLDRMIVDLRLKQDKAAAEKERREAAAATAAAAANGQRPRKKAKIEEEYDDDNKGFHFVAYVAAGGFVWRMDGMESFPRKLGELSEGTDWISMVLPELSATWESASSRTLEFSLLSLTASTDSEQHAVADEQKITRMREDWGPFIAQLVRIHAEIGDLKEKLS